MDPFAESSKYFPTALQAFSFFDKYSRFDNNLGRRETWLETVNRAVGFLRELSENRLDVADYDLIHDSILNLRVMPSMRLLASAGAQARKTHISAYNCSYLPIDSIDAFVEVLLLSMNGCGVGFSVENKHVAKLPEIIPQKGYSFTHVVADSTEGWALALRTCLDAAYYGINVIFDFSKLRPAGAVLKTKGGHASGPLPLKNLVMFIGDTFRRLSGKKLTSLDVHDIVCEIGNAAVSGGSRRTALISLFDHNDELMLHSKDGAFPERRWNANNSAVWPDNIEQGSFSNLFDSMISGQRGEPGIFIRGNADRTKPKRRLSADWGSNPCQPGFAKLLTPTGIKPFDAVSIGDTIWSGSKWTTVVNKMRTGIKPVYSYKTSFGSFVGTENHKVFQNGTRIEVKDASSIDVCAGHESMDSVGSYLNMDAVVDGLVIGDGSVHKASNNLVFLCVGENDGDYFSDAVNSHFEKARPGLKPTAWEVRTTITSDELQKTYERVVPDRYYFGNANTVASFLRGLYSANGSVINNRVTLKQASYKLVCQVQEMLSLLGIRSYLTVNKAHDVEHANGVYESRESYDLNITSDRYVFERLIGFIQKYKNKKIQGLINNRIKSAHVQSVEFVGYHEVYDITVDAEEHSYWTSGLLVSNCGEIFLRPMQMCNLSVAVARADDTIHTLMSKVRVAAMIGTIQSMATNFPGLRSEWKANCEEERLLGVDITGQMDSELVRRANVQSGLREYAVLVNNQFSKILDINPSTAVTCVKPSGNSAALLDCSSGIHPRWSQYYIRNARVSAHSPLYKVLRDSEVPMSPENGQTEDGANTYVVHFPIKSPDGAIVRGDVTAISQCDYWAQVKQNWTEHNPSVTVTYRPEEVPALTDWVWNNRDIIGGMAFLPHSDSLYEQMPYQEITKGEYEQKVKEFPQIDFSRIQLYEKFDETTAASEIACSSGLCDSDQPTK